VSGSGMIAAIPDGLAELAGLRDDLAVLTEAERRSGLMRTRTDVFSRSLAIVAEVVRHNIALGIICHAAAKCTEVQSLADCGRIDRDGADLFVRRYSESIADIVALIAPPAPKQKGN